jgi:hypothetical protein
VAYGVFDLQDFVGEDSAGENETVGEDVFFGSFDAVESPVVEGYGSGELEFYFAPGVEFCDIFADEGVLVDSVFVGHDCGHAGDSAFEAF